MKKEEIIDIIISALRLADVLDNYTKMQGGKAVNVVLKDHTFFNITMAESDNDYKGKKN